MPPDQTILEVEVDLDDYRVPPTRPAAMLIACVRWYQRHGSARVAKITDCRFYPTCSEYARLALVRHGARKGLPMALRRWRSCTASNTASCIDFP